MKVGDLVRHPVSVANTGLCYAGLVVKIGKGVGCTIARATGAMILWHHGEIYYAPISELEVISGSTCKQDNCVV